MDKHTTYNAASLEILKGLDPVRKRPGMYTETQRPNHLAQEVIDNAVDEAIAGFANSIAVTLFEDGSLEVRDNGRGMPTDIHPEEGITGVEVILMKLHSGAKFSNKDYRFSGGLHGVGVSVVNALSEKLEVTIRRGGQRYFMSFSNGRKETDLKVVETIGINDRGTTVRFWPNPQYFDSAKFSVGRLKHTLRAKAVLCPKLKVSLYNEAINEKEVWYYESGLTDYLMGNIEGIQTVPDFPFGGTFKGKDEEVEWAIVWHPEYDTNLAESYINLIPTPLGGTHVNGFRTGILSSIREFCEFRKLLPRGITLTPEDVWSKCSYILSAKILNPQFSGQTKERLSSRQCSAFISSVVKDAFSLWLNNHTEIGEKLAEIAIDSARIRAKSSKKVIRRKQINGPQLPGKLTDCITQDLQVTELFLVEGDSAGGSAKQARDRQFQAIMPLRGKILNTWEIESGSILSSKEVHDISVAIGIDPGSSDLNGLRYGKICILADADSDGQHIATLLCALFLKHFRPLVERGHIYVAMPPLYRIDIGKNVRYALDEEEKDAIIKRAKNKKGSINVQRFKGLGEMNPLQLRETTMAPDTRRLVQLTIGSDDEASQTLDMLLSKKRSMDRKIWLEKEGNLADA